MEKKGFSFNRTEDESCRGSEISFLDNEEDVAPPRVVIVICSLLWLQRLRCSGALPPPSKPKRITRFRAKHRLNFTLIKLSNQSSLQWSLLGRSNVVKTQGNRPLPHPRTRMKAVMIFLIYREQDIAYIFLLNTIFPTFIIEEMSTNFGLVNTSE